MENKSSTKFDQRADAKLDAFQEEMNEFGLTVSRSITGRFSDDEGTFYIDMRTRPEPLKGNKGTVDRLKAAGYVVAKTMHTEKNRQFYVFFVVKPDSIPTVGGSELTIDEQEEPQTITKLELKERQAFAAFQEEMTSFGLTVICASTHRYRAPGGTQIGMVTERLPVKGNKDLIERLKAAGYTVRRFSDTERATGKRFATFNVQKWPVVPAEDDDLQPVTVWPESDLNTIAEAVQDITEGRTGRDTHLEAIDKELDNLEGCEDNPVYATKIQQLRREQEELRVTEPAPPPKQIKVEWCENFIRATFKRLPEGITGIYTGHFWDLAEKAGLWVRETYGSPMSQALAKLVTVRDQKDEDGNTIYTAFVLKPAT